MQSYRDSRWIWYRHANQAVFPLLLVCVPFEQIVGLFLIWFGDAKCAESVVHLYTDWIHSLAVDINFVNCSSIRCNIRCSVYLEKHRHFKAAWLSFVSKHIKINLEIILSLAKMGIPKFYQHLCDRYPNISQTLHANQVLFCHFHLFENQLLSFLHFASYCGDFFFV